MFKNVASQKLTVYVFDSTTNLPKTGDAANLTAYRSLDDGAVTVLGDTSATEMDSTNAKGFYIFDLTQGETNGDKNLYTCKSSTANMVCLAMPAVNYTVPANFTTFSIDSSGNGKATLADAVAHGGTLGSSTATFAMSRASIVSQSANTAAFTITGNGSGAAALWTGGATGIGFNIVGGGTSGDGIKVTTTSGHGLNLAPVGTSMHGLFVTGGNGGTSDGFKAVAGTGGVPIRGDITGNITGTLSTLTTYTGNTPQTGDSFARLGAPAGASVSADMAAVKVDTAAVKVQTDKMTFTVANKMDSNVYTWNGTAVSAPATAGIPEVNVKNMNNVSAAAITTIKAVQGLAVDGVITTLTNLPAIPANWLTAAGTASDFGDEIAASVWRDIVAGDFTVANSIGKSIMNGVALGTGLTIAAVSGAVGSVTGAVGSVTGNIGGNLLGTLSVTERDAIGAALLALTVETGATVKESLRLANAANAGKVDGMATVTGHLRNLADTKNRVTATIDANGNRTAITLDLT